MTHLFFAEDPGAVNYLAPIIQKYNELNIGYVLLCDGLACKHFDMLGEFKYISITNEINASQILNTYDANIIVVGTSENPESMGLMLIDEAKNRSMPTVGIVDGPAMPEYRFRGYSNSPLQHVPDWVIVPDALVKNNFIKLGIKQERILNLGHPLIDKVRVLADELHSEGKERVRSRIFPECVGARPILVFLTEISDGLDPSAYKKNEQYTLTGYSNDNLRTNIVLEEWLIATEKITPKPFRVLRLHPKNSIDEFSLYTDQFDLISKGGEPWPLLFASDVVTGMTSILLLEAVVLGCATLSILPRKIEESWLNIIESGITPAVTKREEIYPALVDCMRENTINIDINKLYPIGAANQTCMFLDSLK